MFETLSRSWGLVKASAGVLRSDKELMLFPVLSGLASLLVLATFALPMFALRVFEHGIGVAGLLLAFVFYFCQYAVIVFFNAALVGAAMIRLDGGDPTLSDGLAAAKRRLPAILGYAAIAATVGVLLQAMKHKDNNVLVRLLAPRAPGDTIRIDARVQALQTERGDRSCSRRCRGAGGW